MSEAELILAKLKIVSETEERGMYLCDKEHSKILLDYITNLQEENKELNDDNIWWNNRFKSVERDNRNLKAKLEMYENGVYFSSENDELQERIDKAIKHLKEVMKDEEEYEEDYIYNKYLLEILKGSEKE